MSFEVVDGERPSLECFPNPADSSSVISKLERGHFMNQKASIFCVSPEPERLVSESVPGGMSGIFPGLGVLLSQQLFGDAIPIKLHYGVPLSINFSALQCPQQSLI